MNILELFSIIASFHISIFIYSVKRYNNKVLEVCFSILPLYLSIVFVRYVYLINLSLVILLFLLPARKEDDDVLDRSQKKDGVLDSFRFIIITCVAIAIFVSDLPIYDSEKLGKRMEYGLGLMDVGAGAFVYNAGLLSLRTNIRKKLYKAFIAAALGTVRLASVYWFDANVDSAEFGRHLNFFYGLGILNLLFTIAVFPFRAPIGLFLCALHEIILKYAGLGDRILNTERENWVTANIEGLSFVLPQFGMALIAAGVSDIYFGNGKKRNAVIYNFIYLILMVVQAYSTGICRRIHNLAYCMVITAFMTTNLLITWASRHYFRKSYFPTHSFASSHMLFILLWSNFLVAIHKLLKVQKEHNVLLAHLASFLYLVLVFVFPRYLLYIIRKFRAKGTK